MVADKGKKSKAPDHGDREDSDHIDSELDLSIEELQEVQDELEKVNEEAYDKVLEVEQKYNEIRRPVYNKRSKIIKSIPDFWLTAFLSHPALGDLLNEQDQKIFKHLSSLDVEDFKDVKSGYTITFNFYPNPYFEETKLTKTFFFSDEGTTEITGTEITWKEGMGISNGDNQKKKGKKRPFVDKSFFTWFSEAQQNDRLENINDKVAEIIKEDLWSDPLRYFYNEADEGDFSEGEEDDDEEEKGEGSINGSEDEESDTEEDN